MFYSVTDMVSKPNTSNLISTKHTNCICQICSLRSGDITKVVCHILHRKPRNQRSKNSKVIYHNWHWSFIWTSWDNTQINHFKRS